MDKQSITVQIINAFAADPEGGNPAGVVLHADELSHDNKLEIARKVGLSETAFVSRSDTADFRLDFYTPSRQIAHCGHATIATFSYLKQLGVLNHSESSKETIDGNRNIQLVGDLAFMEQLAPIYTDVSHLQQQVLRSLGLDVDQLVDQLPLHVVNTGNSFLIVPVNSSDDLKNIQPNFDLISKISDALDLIGYYVFTTDTGEDNLDATTRMFAPRYGIPEESGTGMAAGPLTCFLFDKAGMTQPSFFIEQGKFMGTPSISHITVKLNLSETKIISLMAGGKGVMKEQRHIEINE